MVIELVLKLKKNSDRALVFFLHLQPVVNVIRGVTVCVTGNGPPALVSGLQGSNGDPLQH